MADLKRENKQSCVLVCLVFFCVLQSVAFVGLTIFETHKRSELQRRLVLKRETIANISSTCLSKSKLQQSITHLTRLKRETENLIQRRQNSGIDSSEVHNQEVLLEHSCGNDTKICLNGPKGESGFPGEMGAAGIKGTPGSAGTKGEIGSPGEKGSQGDPGPVGLRGAKGVNGDQGLPGAQGPRGDKGDPGAQGSIGLPGLPGNKGETGSPGVKGQAGVTGMKGEKGMRGQKGEIGERGLKGTPGEMGDRGSSDSQTSQCDCIKKLHFIDSTSAISSQLGLPVTLDCRTNPSLPVTWSHGSNQSCYHATANGSVIHIDHLSPVDIGQHACTVDNGYTHSTKVIQVQTKDTWDGFSCTFENSTCKLHMTSWNVSSNGKDHTQPTGPFIEATNQNSKIESLWMKKEPNSCISFWYKAKRTSTGSHSGQIEILVMDPTCDAANTHNYSQTIFLTMDTPDWTKATLTIPQSYDIYKVLIDVQKSNMAVMIDDLQLHQNGCPSNFHFVNPNNQTVSIPKGGQATIDCSFSGKSSSVSYSFKKEGSCTSFVNNGIQNITKASIKDAGKYVCQLTGPQGQIKEKTVNIVIGGDHTCTFENGLCEWIQQTDDNFDWIKYQRSTPSTGTGPSNDHTLGNSNGYYLYLESSSGSPGKTASLKSEILPAGTNCFSFAHHMYGSAMGTLNIYTEQCNTSSRKLIWSLSGNQGDHWSDQCIRIPSMSKDYRIYIEAVRGTSYTSDIAIDDLSILTGTANQPCSCSSLTGMNFLDPGNKTVIIPLGGSGVVNCAHQPLKPYSTFGLVREGTCAIANPSRISILTIQNATLLDGGTYTCTLRRGGQTVEKIVNVEINGTNVCTFEHGLCDWIQERNDGYDFTLHSGNTSSKDTGPSADHTIGDSSGKYLYMEASNPPYGSTAILKSPLLPPGPLCFGFAYHMYGATMGQLNVKAKVCDEMQQKTLWTKRGNHGNNWFEQCIKIPKLRKDYNIFIEAIRGRDFTSDAAIDDLYLWSVSDNEACDCSKLQKLRPSIAPKVYVSQCNFDGPSFCDWKQHTNDTFDWNLLSQATGSQETGPTSDHTTGRGAYIYTEASSPRKIGDKADLESTFVIHPGKDYCLSFFYHMYGSQMGSLNVYKSGGTSTSLVKIFTLNGPHTNAWHQQQVNLPAAPNDYRLLFSGVIGSGFKSDIALDDVAVYEGKC